jgi:hypothetical protein
MALGSTQPLTEMSARNLLGSKGRPARKADNRTAICDPIVYKVWEPRRLNPMDYFFFTNEIPETAFRRYKSGPPENPVIRNSLKVSNLIENVNYVRGAG